jgi:CBS domain-containing protein
MRVRELMTTRIWSCARHSSLSAAAETMLDHDCGFVPIVDEESRVIGVLTDRDICMALVRETRPAFDVPAISVAAGKRVFSCSPDDDVHDAMEIMEKARVHRLVVVDQENRLRGIVSMTDVLRHALPGRGPDVDCLTCAEAVGALRIIRARRRHSGPRPVAAE